MSNLVAGSRVEVMDMNVGLNANSSGNSSVPAFAQEFVTGQHYQQPAAQQQQVAFQAHYQQQQLPWQTLHPTQPLAPLQQQLASQPQSAAAPAIQHQLQPGPGPFLQQALASEQHLQQQQQQAPLVLLAYPQQPVN